MSGGSGLPVDAALPALRAALRDHSCAILTAEPGAGKTTRVPLALLDEPWLAGRRIVMLEPRRLAARAAAGFMARSLGETAGETVGYTVRLDRRVSVRTRIEVVTEGILTRRLQSDPSLDGVSLLIFDEFHERSLDGDLGLALALDVQRGLREDLKILIMSATLDAAGLSAHLGNAPAVAASGRVFPVEVRYLDKAERRTLARDMARAITRALAEAEGSVLAFLPGEAEIRRATDLLSDLGNDIRIMPLYGAMKIEDQEAAIRPAPPGIRKVVLATTIAETSLTIEGIGVVVDCGLKRRPRFDPASGMSALETVRVSLASAEQRRGRAGRLGPGVCYRLWPEAENRALKPFDAPEILEADLASLALELAAWGISDPKQLQWLDPPPAAPYAQARDLLASLGAIDARSAVTAGGKAMAALPLHPRLAHMVVAGEALGAGATAADLAALLSERDIVERGAGVDLGLRLDLLRHGCGGARESVKAAARQIRQIARVSRDASAVSPGPLLALAFPDRIGQRRGGHGRYRLSGGGGAVLPEHDGLAVHDWLAIATTDGAAGDQRIFLAAALSRAEIELHFANQIETRDILRWDSRSQSVTAARQRRLGALLLDERPLASPDPETVAQAMIAGVREVGLGSLPWTDGARNLQARVAFLCRVMPEGNWPDLSDATLAATLEHWLAPYLAGMTRRAHLERLDLHAILRSLMPRALLHRLDALAPARINVPSGAEMAIDYGEGDPTLCVRLQEMFGMAQTPRLAEGRAKLRIELLSPARRPIAVTQSLETFWHNVYPQVRAEMRGRYPKHVWPENPLAAAPVKPGKVR